MLAQSPAKSSTGSMWIWALLITTVTNVMVSSATEDTTTIDPLDVTTMGDSMAVTDDPCDGGLCGEEGADGVFTCTLDQLRSSATLSDVWYQYCSSVTSGSKSFAMTLDCTDAGFANVSGEISQSYAGALANCRGQNNATDCKIFDKMGSQCAAASASHVMKVNVQMDATTFSYDDRVLAAVKSAIMGLHAGIDMSQIDTMLEVFHCGPNDQCPADPSTTMATTTTADELMGTTTEDASEAGNSDVRRLRAARWARVSTPETSSDSLHGSQDSFRHAGGEAVAPVQRPRRRLGWRARGATHRQLAGASASGVLHSVGSGRSLTDDGENLTDDGGNNDTDDLDDVSEDAFCPPDLEFELCDGALPAGLFTPPDSYGCVCGLEGECPLDPEDLLCAAPPLDMTTTDGEFAMMTTDLDEQSDVSARRLSERPRRRIGWRSRGHAGTVGKSAARGGWAPTYGEFAMTTADLDEQSDVSARRLSERPRRRIGWRSRGHAGTEGKSAARGARSGSQSLRKRQYGLSDIASEAEGPPQFDIGRRLGARGVGGAVVIATSTINASAADIKLLKEKHDTMGSSAVWFLDNQFKVHLMRNAVGIQSANSGRRLTSGPQHGVVSVTSSEVDGVDLQNPESGDSTEVDVAGFLAILLVVIFIAVWILASLFFAFYCTWKAKKRKAASWWEPPPADTTVFKMPDPRFGAAGFDVPIVAFGSGNDVSERCNSSVLENTFDMSVVKGLQVQAPADSDARKFLSSEAAFLALPFWSKASAFKDLKVEEAREKAAVEFRGTEDQFDRLGGFASQWAGMKAILESKFSEERLKEALLSTQDSFLLLHPSVDDKDRTWSDNWDGEGENKLGMLLMLIRDEMAAPRVRTWGNFTKDLYNVDTGRARSLEKSKTWQHIVRTARAVVMDEPMPPHPSTETPTPLQETVPVKVIVSGVCYSSLLSHRLPKTEFDAVVQDTLAAHAGNGLQAKDVTLRLYAGSVIADATINCPPAVSSSQVKQDLCTSGNLPGTLTQRFNDMVHLSMVQNDDISVEVMVDGVPLVWIDPIKPPKPVDDPPPEPDPPKPLMPFLLPEVDEPHVKPANGYGNGNGNAFLPPVNGNGNGNGNGNAFLPPVPSRPSPPLARRPEAPMGMNPADTKRGKKIPLTWRGGVIATKV